MGSGITRAEDDVKSMAALRLYVNTSFYTGRPKYLCILVPAGSQGRGSALAPLSHRAFYALQCCVVLTACCAHFLQEDAREDSRE